MSVENKFARIMRNTGPARFFIPLGIILIIAGVLMLGINTDNYIETTGKIASVTECPRLEDEVQSYDVAVTYTVDNKNYETTFANMSGEYKVGADIKVLYDPADPTRTSNARLPKFVAPLLIALGAAAMIYGVYKTVSAFKKSKQLDNSVPGGGKFPSAEFEGIKTAPGVTEYYFRFDGNSLKPGYIVEDAARNIIYEGKMTKQALVGARTYEFSNHVTATVRTHEVGHTVTQAYNDEFFSAKSWFKFDGKNIWDVVHERGIRISTNLHSKFPNCIYDIAQNGAAFARVETCGIYVHEDEAEQHTVNIPTGSMYYRCWTASNDFDSLFLAVFAISETEQAVVE